MKSWATETDGAAWRVAGYTLQPTTAAAAAAQQNQTGLKQITPTKTTAAKCQFGNVIYTHIALWGPSINDVSKEGGPVGGPCGKGQNSEKF